MFHKKYEDLILSAAGSAHNHHAWQGGYADHIIEIFKIAKILYRTMDGFRKLIFALDSALIVLYFHDIEKIWKHSQAKEDIDKLEFYNHGIKEFGLSFTDDEMNALKYIHGEKDDYRADARIMNPLAAFCHCVDTMSARIWFDYGY